MVFVLRENVQFFFQLPNYKYNNNNNICNHVIIVRIRIFYCVFNMV